MSAPGLRPYQIRATDRVLAEFAAGRRRVLIVAPTGAGKTVMFAALAERFHAEGKRVLVVAHREELIEQAVAKLRAAGVERVGVYRGAANSRDLDGATCVVASIQARGLAQFGADLVIVDEAHHAPAESYARLLDLFPAAHHVGATATPWWGNGKGLGSYFQTIVTATTVRELTDLGHLARVRMFTHPHTLRDLDLRGVAVSGDDFKIASLSERVDRPALLGDIVTHWQSHAGGARTLCFAASVEHSGHIVDRFRAAGIAAEHLDGDTPNEERRAILARLRSGETRVVSNYAVLTEGFDEPSVGCVILARPTRRAQVYLQAVGRGLRVGGTKDSVTVLDHAGLCLAFGFPDDERPVSLEETEAGECGGLAPVRRCPACGLMVPAAVRECPECAATLREAVPTEEPSGVLVEAIRASAPVAVEPRRVTAPPQMVGDIRRAGRPPPAASLRVLGAERWPDDPAVRRRFVGALYARDDRTAWRDLVAWAWAEQHDEVAGGSSLAAVCELLGISKPRLCAWRAEDPDGVGALPAARLKRAPGTAIKGDTRTARESTKGRPRGRPRRSSAADIDH